MTPIESFAILLALLFVKHFAADGPLQTPYQLANKGVWMHPGGLLHAGAHTGLSALAITVWGLLFAPAQADFLTLMAVLADAAWGLLQSKPFEFVAHYLVDYAKCAYDARGKLSRLEIGADGVKRLVIDRTDAYFIAFLADQLMHALTMIAMVVILAAWLL